MLVRGGVCCEMGVEVGIVEGGCRAFGGGLVFVRKV